MNIEEAFLSGKAEGDAMRILTNPFYAINISPMMAEPHEVLIKEDQFIQAGVRLIDEMGAEKYLENLLENLKGNFVTAEE